MMNADVKIHRKYGYIRVKQPLGVDDRDLDEQDVGQEAPDLPPSVLLAAADQHLGLLAAVDLDDPRLVELGDEPRQVLDRDRLRPVLPLERLLDVLERLLAVELLEQEVFLDLEPEILQRQGVLDDVVRHPLVELGLDDQVGAQPDLQVFGGLAERHGSGARLGAELIGQGPPGVRGESIGSRIV